MYTEQEPCFLLEHPLNKTEFFNKFLFHGTDRLCMDKIQSLMDDYFISQLFHEVSDFSIDVELNIIVNYDLIKELTGKTGDNNAYVRNDDIYQGYHLLYKKYLLNKLIVNFKK
jgi:hypothetical protein